MYKILLPRKMMKDLWLLREYYGEPAIIVQIRSAISNYLEQKETEIGAPIEDVAETIEKHDWKKARQKEIKEIEESEKSAFAYE